MPLLDLNDTVTRLSLLSLPVELLYEIHLFALSEHFPHICRHLHAVCKNASPSVHAEYLLRRVAQPSPHPTTKPISKALRYPLCSIPVLTALLQHPLCPNLEPSPEIPRRLFRTLVARTPSDPPWTMRDHPLPILDALYNTETGIPTLNVDAYEGYALTKAVFAGAYPLVRFLLEQGAQPRLKDGLAVVVAIRRRDLSLVRMLVERDYFPPAAMVPATKRRFKSLKLLDHETSEVNGKPGAKRRRMEDRVEVTKEMLRTAVKCDAKDIVDYFTVEKGCVPDMKTLRMLRR